VNIDASGKVVSAKAVDAVTPEQKLLAAPAAQSALLWRFEPARRNGEAVPSDSVLSFQFDGR
jgi:hypothetical protein